MSIWTVVVSGAAVDELNALPADLRARFARITTLIEHFGLPNVREPHVKHLEGSLWEMRLKGRDGIARAVYVNASGNRIVVVRVFVKKSQKTPRREIEIALERARSIRDNKARSRR
jgi:phage-related protein